MSGYVIGLLKNFLYPSFADETDVLLAARKRLVHVMCLISGAICLAYSWSELALILSGGYSYHSSILYFIAPLLYFGMVALAARGLFVKSISVGLLALYYLFTMMMRVDTGVFAPGAVYFMAIPMLAGMLLGVRAGIGAALFIMMTYAVLYVFRDQFPAPSRLVSPDEVAIQSAVSFSVLGAACTASALFFMHVMQDVIHKSRAAYTELEEYRQNLEGLVEARTMTIREQSVELESALSSARETNALQNQLVSVVSHEIRTPLAIIDGSARRIARQADAAEPEDLKRRSEVIHQNVLRLTQLIERTLESARYAEGVMDLQAVEFDFTVMLQGVLTRQIENAPAHVFEVDLDALPTIAVGDPNLLDHVFSNIFANAVKYSPEDSVISIRSRTEDGDLIISIRDNGIGIPKGELSKIASRFFRASTALNIPGTGVGLALTRQILEDHGARLEIDSVEGEWTEVSVHFPLERLIPGAGTATDRLAV